MSEEMKQELDSLKTEMRRGFDRLETIMRNLAVEYARARGDIEDIKRDMKENMVTKSEFRESISHLEAFAGKVESFGRQWVIHGDVLMGHHDRLVNHENRIVHLESRPKPA